MGFVGKTNTITDILKKEIMKTIWYGWNFMRGLRLVMGLAAVGQAIATKEWIVGLAGGFLVFMALANIGCCGANGCAVPDSRARVTKVTDKDVSRK